MGPKTSRLQIRVSPDQKAGLRRLAAAAGVSVSQYVLSKALPTSQAEFARLAGDLVEHGTRRAALAALHDFLAALEADQFALAVADLERTGLSPLLQNYAAAAVERVARLKEIAPPDWTALVAPLDRPHFAWEPRSLRPHLMRLTPIAFKRRNLFVDAAGVESGDRRRVS